MTSVAIGEGGFSGEPTRDVLIVKMAFNAEEFPVLKGEISVAIECATKEMAFYKAAKALSLMDGAPQAAVDAAELYDSDKISDDIAIISDPAFAHIGVSWGMEHPALKGTGCYLEAVSIDGTRGVFTGYGEPDGDGYVAGVCFTADITEAEQEVVATVIPADSSANVYLHDSPIVDEQIASLSADLYQTE